MRYYPVTRDGTPADPLELPVVIQSGIALPPGSFHEPPIPAERQQVVLSPDGWIIRPAFVGMLWSAVSGPDGRVEVAGKNWGEADFGVDPFTEGWTDIEPPADLGPADRITAFDATKKRWLVTREAKADREAREEAEAAARLAAERAAMQLSNVELSEALFLAGKISADEAEAFASTGAVPEGMLRAISQAMLAAGLTPEQQTLARIKLKGLMVYRRTSPLVPLMGKALKMDDTALDRLFGQKAA